MAAQVAGQVFFDPWDQMDSVGETVETGGLMGDAGSLAAAASINNNASAGSYSGPGASMMIGQKAVGWWLGLVLAFLLLKFIAEHEKVGIEGEHIKIGAWNLIIIGLAAWIFLAAGKVALSIWRVPGLTELAQFS